MSFPSHSASWRIPAVLATCRWLVFSLFVSHAVAKTAPESPLQEGDPLGIFYVTKVAGAVDDGVEAGEEVCYRCRYGSSPMVIVFARRIDGPMVELTEWLDEAVEKDQESRLRGIITLWGDKTSELKKEASVLAAKASADQIPISIAKQDKTGPLNYKLPPEASVIVVIAANSQVYRTHTFREGNIDVPAIISDVEQILD